MKSATSFGRAQFTKQYSLPASQFVGKSMSRSSRSSSISSLHSDTEQVRQTFYFLFIIWESEMSIEIDMSGIRRRLFPEAATGCVL